MSSSSNNYYSNVNNIDNGVYPLSLYLSSFSNHENIISNPYNHHQFIASPGQMVSAVPESHNNYLAFSSNNVDVSKGIKKPVKKDRHSKIYTAQGLRDRRVRLSIGIARQFFDLQDMLGFDKASKTLDWLLKKSRNSIQEVVQAKRVRCSIKNSDEDNGNNGEDLAENEEDQEEEEDEDKSSSVEYWEEVVCEVKKPEKSSILSKTLRGKAIGKAKEKSKEMVTQSEILNPFMRSINFNEGEEKLSINVPDSDMTNSVYKEAFEEFTRFPRKEISNQESRKIDLPMEMGQSYNQQSYAILNQNLDFDYDQNTSIDHPFCSLPEMNFGRGFS